MGTRVGLSSAQKAAYIAAQQAEFDCLDFFSCSDFGADLETIVAGVNLLQPTTKYRLTTVGKLLTESLDLLRMENKISENIYEKTLRQFDRSIINVMGQTLTSRLTFRASKLKAYKFLDNEWCFILDEVEFREFSFLANVPRLKILAFDGRNYAGLRGSGKRRWKTVENKNNQDVGGARRKRR